VSGGALTVEVTYALAQEQAVVQLKVEPGVTLRQAIERSGLLERYPGINLAAVRVGVFGKLRELDEPVSAGERIEIYRPLIADPRERRRRAAKKKF
jgi:hypothetical protein